MKRFLCILLCLVLAIPAALADDKTPTQLFHQQFQVGGNGLRGTVTLTVSGVADWVDVLMPFAGNKMQVRIIGEKQGDLSNVVTDDDDWQVKFWVKDAEGGEQALTCFFGSPEGISMTTALLPDTVLTLPVENVNLPYQLKNGEWLPLLRAFAPILLEDNGGNASAITGILGVGAVSDADWEAHWAPVLSKYETLMDMWLAGYAAPMVVSGTAGHMTLRTTYEIPADAMKAQMKYIIGVMMTDAELMALVSPYLTQEQISLYLNPAMLWFYEYCIDVAPLEGSILLEREMTTLGETTAMTISLPVTALPAEITQPLGAMAASLFSLPYEDAFAGINRVDIRMSGGDLSVSLNSPLRTVSLLVDDRTEGEDAINWAGYLRITPAVGVEEPPLSAAFAYTSSSTLWQDEEYKTHEDFAWALTVEPDMSLVSEDDPFHSTYVDFMPLAFSASAAYTKKEAQASPVQLVLALEVVLPDSTFTLDANLKVAERWAHDTVPTQPGENVLTLSHQRQEELRNLFVTNAVQTITTLAAPAQ